MIIPIDFHETPEGTNTDNADDGLYEYIGAWKELALAKDPDMEAFVVAADNHAQKHVAAATGKVMNLRVLRFELDNERRRYSFVYRDPDHKPAKDK